MQHLCTLRGLILWNRHLWEWVQLQLARLYTMVASRTLQHSNLCTTSSKYGLAFAFAWWNLFISYFFWDYEPSMHPLYLSFFFFLVFRFFCTYKWKLCLLHLLFLFLVLLLGPGSVAMGNWGSLLINQNVLCYFVFFLKDNLVVTYNII